MYTDFYGLKERPFALLPDPRYLFLSESHREALAHLLYGIEAGEGFIQVVGQVGTGKTTLCRTLLGRIGSDVEIAYIFNPSPSAEELLAAINREFGLPTTARSRVELIEQLNRFLLEKRAQDRRVLLVIDEAQNLEPGVLEQIRLLSNLETEREKLVQIALIGQPELEENLARADLRQLRQRITVRWTLSPFSSREVGEYLKHRLQVAGRDRVDLFTRGAVGALYRASRGIPRVINAIADRALLAGYTRGKPRIDAATVRLASRELPLSETGRSHHALGLAPATAAALLACGLGLGLFATIWWPSAFASRDSVTIPAQASGLADVSAAPAADDADQTLEVAADASGLQQALALRTTNGSAAAALDALLARWGHNSPVGLEVEPNQFASAVREVAPLRVYVTRTSLERLARINTPAIVELELSASERRYAALVALDPDGTAHLGLREQLFTLEPGAFEALWTGRTFYVWSNYESMPALLPGMNGSAVRWLQARMTELGYLKRGDASGIFDPHTTGAVQRFQTDSALDDTGQVGPETLIAIYQALDYPTPRLYKSDAGEPS